MTLKLSIDITDLDEYSLAYVLEIISKQITHGYFRGFDETTKEIGEIDVPCHYSYQITEQL